MEQIDEDSMYAQLLKQPADNDNDKPSSGSKVHAKQNVQVLNVESTSTSNINPDVVKETYDTHTHTWKTPQQNVVLRYLIGI